MPNFSDLYPSGGVVKSVQRGVFQIPNSVSSAAITVSAVNPAKAFLNVIPPGNFNGGISGYQTIQLAGATQISITDVANDNTSKKFSWELIEFY